MNSLYNTETNRYIKVNGRLYNSLTKKGYYIDNNGNLNPPKPKSPKSPKTYVYVKKIKKNPIETLKIETMTIEPILLALEPKDLLSLYITNKQIKFNTHTLLLLSNKYNLPKVSSFTEFIKLYNKSLINDKISYLYDLENNIEMPSITYMKKLIGDELNVTKKIRGIVMNWMVDFLKHLTYAKKQPEFFGLAMTLFDAYLFHNMTLDKTEAQITICACVYLTEYLLLDDRSDLEKYEEWTGFTENKLRKKIKDVFNVLNGTLIRPSTVFFIEMNENVKNLVYISYLIPNLIVYKPSMIAEAISYIVYGKYKIYSMSELNPICKLLTKYVQLLHESTLSNFRLMAIEAHQYINFTCGTDVQEIKESPFKYKEPWHLGTYEKIKVIGQGAYGKVTHIKRNECTKDFVIKTNLSEEQNESLLEIAILKQIKDNNVIQLCHYELTRKIEMYMPYMQYTIKSLLDNNLFDKSKIPIYFKQLVSGLHACHQNDVIHRDIKIENIVFDGNQFKLIDFGISVTYSSFRYYLDPIMACTFEYRSPEALLFNKHYGREIDIWALGVVFYYILTGKFLYDTNDDIKALKEIFKIFGSSLTLPYGFPKLPIYPRNEAYINEIFGEYPYILSCFTYDPKLRPSTSQLLEMI